MDDRAATTSDLPAVVATLQSAFFADPVWGAWAFPDEETRAAPLARLLSAWAEPPVPHGWVRMTPRAEAVAVWIPPRVPEMTAAEEAAFETLTAELFGSRAGELAALFAQFEGTHPDEPHYYLSLWATHRDHAGHGLGTALMEQCLARIDAEGMPAYLESTHPRNLARYEALGFRPRAEFGPPGGPVITTMWREPGSTG